MGIPLNQIVLRHGLPQDYPAPAEWFWFIRQWCTRVEHSLHYNALFGDVARVTEYRSYISNQPDHSLTNFYDLYNTFDISKMEPIELAAIEDLHIVLDGCHRLAILKYKQIIDDHLPEELFTIRQFCHLGEWVPIPRLDIQRP